MKIKICKYCGCQDDGKIPFVLDERKCIPCRNLLKKSKYNTDNSYKSKILEINNKSRKSIKFDENGNRLYNREFISIPREEYKKEYLSKYRELNKDSKLEYNRQYYENNKSTYICNSTLRKKHIKIATPKWLTEEDFDKIKSLYKQAKDLEKLTGIKFHIDHEIPLRGKFVSGLNIPSNLRIIPAKENLQKKNKFEIS